VLDVLEDTPSLYPRALSFSLSFLQLLKEWREGVNLYFALFEIIGNCALAEIARINIVCRNGINVVQIR